MNPLLSVSRDERLQKTVWVEESGLADCQSFRLSSLSALRKNAIGGLDLRMDRTIRQMICNVLSRPTSANRMKMMS